MKLKKPLLYLSLYTFVAVIGLFLVNSVYSSITASQNDFSDYKTIDVSDLMNDPMPYTGVYIPNLDQMGLRVIVEETDKDNLYLVLSSGIYQLDFYLGSDLQDQTTVDFYSDQYQRIAINDSIHYDSIIFKNLTGKNNKLIYLLPFQEESELANLEPFNWNGLQSALGGSYYNLNPDRSQITGITANLVEYSNDEITLSIRNISNLNIELLELIEVNSNRFIDIPISQISFFSFGEDILIEIPFTNFDLYKDYQVSYRYEGIESILSVNLSMLDNTNTEIIMKTGIVYENFEAMNLFFKVEGSSIQLINDQTIIDQAISIPSGYTLVLKEGQSITFTNDAFIRSYSTIEFLGSKELPILIRAQDHSQSGISVIQANERSIMNYVELDNLSNIDFEAYTTTGALNFYESDVDMDNVTIRNNRSEDGLNIVRSNFNVSNAIFDSTFSDAFDSDFSTGTLSDSLFINTGNDGFDCSGSEVSISNIDFINIGDKALSIGEGTSINGSNLVLDTMDLGIAVKDSSTAIFDQVSFIDTYLSFVQYNKKAVYGVSQTSLSNVSFEGDIGLYYLIQEHESLIIDDELYIPTNLSKSDQIFDALINERPLR